MNNFKRFFAITAILALYAAPLCGAQKSAEKQLKKAEAAARTGQVAKAQKLLATAKRNIAKVLNKTALLGKVKNIENILSAVPQVKKIPVQDRTMAPTVPVVTAPTIMPVTPAKRPITEIGHVSEPLPKRQKIPVVMSLIEELKQRQRQKQITPVETTPAMDPLHAKVDSLHQANIQLTEQLQQERTAHQSTIHDMQKQISDMDKDKNAIETSLQEQISDLQQQNQDLLTQSQNAQKGQTSTGSDETAQKLIAMQKTHIDSLNEATSFFENKIEELTISSETERTKLNEHIAKLEDALATQPPSLPQAPPIPLPVVPGRVPTTVTTPTTTTTIPTAPQGLLSAITEGVQLRKTPTTTTTTDRGALLAAITGDVQLRKTPKTQPKAETKPSGGIGSLSDALEQALAKRRETVKPKEEEESDEDEDWD